MTQKYSVLVVDDQPNWRELLTELLEDDFDVTSVDSYDTALKTIKKRVLPFHVVVTDMRLIDKDTDDEAGLQLAAEINKRGQETKTIIVTGYATLRTAKRALGYLNVYDYLEKMPSDASHFDIAGFLRLVRTAAEEAEKARPDGSTHPDNHLLLLVSDDSLRKKLTEILQKHYEVEIIDDFADIENSLASLSHSFPVTLISEDLSRNEALLDVLQETQPQTKIILLTRESSRILKLLHRAPIANAIPISPAKPDRLEILDGIQQVLSPALTKYGILNIASPDGQEMVLESGLQLKPGTTYRVSLKMQDVSTLTSFPIQLLPTKSGKKRSVILDVFITSQNIRIEPGGNLRWRIDRPLDFQITPTGKGKILLEIRQGYRLAGKKEIILEF